MAGEAKKFGVHIDLQGNELKNAAFDKAASAPSNPFEGQHYYNTSDHKEYVYNGTAWVEETSQGDYTFQNGVELESGTRNVQLNIASGANAGNVTLSAGANGLAASVAEASTSAKGIIEIATDQEAAAGSSETLAVNPKQLAAGLSGKIGLTDLSIASGSANYLGYDNTNGQISAKVDSTVTDASTNLITSGGVKSYVDGKISSTYKPGGTVAFASRPSLAAGIEGNVYNISDAFTTTSDFVEGSGKNYPAGTNIVCINTAASGQTAVYKWDVLAGFIDLSNYMTPSSIATLTNKTFDANGTGNSISNLETADFASGVIVTATGSASGSDSKIMSEKKTNEAIASAVSGMLKGQAVDNTALTPSSGIATWTIALTSGQKVYSCQVFEKSSGEEVIANVKITNGTSVVIKMNSADNIAAATYTAKLVGEL